MRQKGKRLIRGSGSTLLAVRDAAELLGVHINTVRNWSDRGLIPTYRVGPRRDRRFRLEDVSLFLDPEARRNE